MFFGNACIQASPHQPRKGGPSGRALLDGGAGQWQGQRTTQNALRESRAIRPQGSPIPNRTVVIGKLETQVPVGVRNLHLA